MTVASDSLGNQYFVVPQDRKRIRQLTPNDKNVLKENLEIEPFKQYEHLMLSAGTATTVGVTQSATKNQVILTLRRPIATHKENKIAISRKIGHRWHLVGFGTIQ